MANSRRSHRVWYIKLGQVRKGLIYTSKAQLRDAVAYHAGYVGVSHVITYHGDWVVRDATGAAVVRLETKEAALMAAALLEGTKT